MEINLRQREFIASIICEADESQVIELHNTYCDRHLYEGRFYSMLDLDEVLCGKSPSEVISALSSNFNINDYYFIDTIYGLESTSDILFKIDENALAEYLIEHGDVAEILRDNEDEIIYEFKECLKEELKGYEIDVDHFWEWYDEEISDYDALDNDWEDLISDIISNYTETLEDDEN